MYYSWTVPTATDNSGIRPIVTVTPILMPPLQLGPGVTSITYLAEDAEGNIANCTFAITVEGKLPTFSDGLSDSLVKNLLTYHCNKIGKFAY